MPKRNSGPRLKWLEKRNCYYIVWSENGRSRERSTGFRDRSEAEKKLAEFILQRTTTRGPHSPHEMLITEALFAYAEAHQGRKSAGRIGYALVPLTKFFAHKVISEINESLCRRYEKHRARSAGTVRRELTVLRASVNHMASTSTLTHKVNVWLPPNPEPRDIYLTRSEFARLLKQARKRPRSGRMLSLFMLICVYTGRRRGAVLSLRWPAINLSSGTIDFRRSNTAENNKKRGIVKIHRKLLGHLRRAHRNANNPIGYVVSRNGHHIKDLKESFQRAAELADLPLHITPHVLKHTCATWMMEEGVSIWDAAQYLCTSVQTIEKVYAHHSPDAHERALRAFK